MSAIYRVKYTIEVGTSKRSTESLEFYCTGKLPFVPHPGMMIAPMKGDDLREVEIVYWLADAPDRLEVHFKWSDMNSPGLMRRCGWKEEV